MTISQTLLHSLASDLDQAMRLRAPIPSLSQRHSDLREEDAYAIQQMNATRALKEGRRVIGYKLGLTSREAQRHFQVFKPDFGHLFDDTSVLEDTEIDLSQLIQPKIEGEIAFVLGRDLRGPGVTVVDVLHAIDYATVALEILDSRIKDWKISSVDTIADNGSSARFVLGGRKQRIDGLDFSSVGMVLSRNGEAMLTGAGSAVMGNPLSAVAFLANELGRQNKGMMAGDFVLSGSLGGMLTPCADDFFSCEIRYLGRTCVRFQRSEKGDR